MNKPRRLTFSAACNALGIEDQAPDENNQVENDDDGDVEVFSDNSDSSDEDEDIGGEGGIEQQINMTSANGIEYTNEPFAARNRERNNLIGRRRLIANPQTPIEAFQLFITEDMIRIIQRCTNIKLRQILPNCRGDTINRDEFTYDEVMAALAIIVRAGSDRDNFNALDDFWSKEDSKPFYRGTMSYHRFKFFQRCVRFDDYRTRDNRIANDKLAPIRDIWTMFVPNLRATLVPNENLTIDEQLLGYRGRIPGRTYMPSKPRKYGLKIFWLCEAPSGFALNGYIYLGRQPGEPAHNNLAFDITMDLCQPFYGSGRNVVMDNFFTSHLLATSLLQHRLTILGTVRLNRRDIPPYIRSLEGRNALSSQFAYDHDNKIIMVSYIPKRNKNVVLMSSTHSENTLEAGDKRRPTLILDYNQSKGGVDTMDENIEEFSCRRKTRRWPLLLFFNLVDIAAYNGYLLMKKHGSNISRKSFLKKLAFQLGKHYAENRLRSPGLHRHIIEAAKIVGYFVEEPVRNEHREPGRAGRCKDCGKTSRSECETCHLHICPLHRHQLKSTKCNECI